MKAKGLVVLIVCGVCLLSAGCGGSEEKAETGSTGAEREAAPLDEKTATAARSRGLAVSEREEADEAGARVVMSELTYEWRTAPEKGLSVVMEFRNPVGGNTRARGYVFLTAHSVLSGHSVTGVYPWDAQLREDGVPLDPTDGTHLLFRDRQQVRAFIPYPEADGYYETLRVMVFHEDGRLIIDRPYDLALSGVSGESRSVDVNPDFDL
jgi:hypothetical protein